MKVDAQISPGPLAKPHADLDTAFNCLKCHGSRPMEELCLDCHRGIRWLVDRQRGLHWAEAEQRCATCHPDHAGREFELIEWDAGEPESFDHQRTGWPLGGKHAALKCAECHKREFKRSPAVALLTRKNLDEGWTGLERDCLSCHEDYHQGTLDRDCLKCHTERVWKPAPRFDHARTVYPLTGKHADVGCAECHMAPHLDLPRDSKGRATPLYRPLAHQECSSCHRDPHGGRLGGSCTGCHVTQDWRRTDEKRFDHDLTQYPLRGRHTRVTCEQCHHPQKAWGPKPPFATCDACHVDPHAGQATLAAAKVDCASCHRVQGFKPSTYTVEQHRSSKYPLEGKHVSVECASCHVKNPRGIPLSTLGKAGVLMRPKFERCTSCHEDDHGGQLASRTDGGACEPCHVVAGWRPSTFTDADHAELKLALEGRHHELECASCHGPVRKGLPALPGPSVLGKARVAVTLREIECKSCHADPHQGRFAPTGERPHREDCRPCHGVETFRPSSIDVAVHAKFHYELEGAHRAVPCSACHEDLRGRPRSSSLVLGDPPPQPLLLAAKQERCTDCHDDPHAGQFAQRTDLGVCESCHGLNVFRPATEFDHDRDAAFPLDGAHARVSCAECHASRTDSEAHEVVIYRPLPVSCESCHGDRPMPPLEDSPAARPSVSTVPGHPTAGSRSAAP